jgi:hypothetical protein
MIGEKRNNMDNKNVINLAAAIVNDKRFGELKNSCYEELVSRDHATVVAIFKALQEWALEGEENSFYAVDKPKLSVARIGAHDLDIDPDLDDSLTQEEINSRK